MSISTTTKCRPCGKDSKGSLVAESAGRGKKMSEYQGLVLEQHVHPSLLVDHVACKEAMFQPLNVVIAKQGTVILMVSLLTRTLA